MAAETVIVKGIYRGINRYKDKRLPHLAYTVHATNSFNKSRTISASIEITDPADLARLENEFHPGDEIQLTIETDWHHQDFPMSLKSFVNLASKS